MPFLAKVIAIATMKLLIVKFEGEEGEGWKPHWLLNLKKNKKNIEKQLKLIEIIEQLYTVYTIPTSQA